MRTEQHNSHVWAFVSAQHSAHVADYAWWQVSGRRSLFATISDNVADIATIERYGYDRDDLSTRCNWDLP